MTLSYASNRNPLLASNLDCSAIACLRSLPLTRALSKFTDTAGFVYDNEVFHHARWQGPILPHVWLQCSYVEL